MRPTFNVLDEPWITVTWLDGRVTEVSIRDIFNHADEIRSISEELPTQSFAQLRLLLAILHRATAGPRTRAEWLEFWHEFPHRDVKEYLDDHSHFFDLLDEKQPFMQVAGLQSTSGDISSLERMIGDVPNNKQYQITRSGAALTSISYKEATRWLLHVHAFDPSGIKSGAVGDPGVKQGRGYPIGQGWSGYLGGIVVEGQNLLETLLLNLVPLTGSDATELGLAAVPEALLETPLASFERVEVSASRADYSVVEPDAPTTRRVMGGPIAMYTWLSRRVRLIHSGGMVTGVILSQGDKKTPQDGYLVEPMAAWRHSAPQTKRYGRDIYMPLEHIAGEALWQSIGAILPSQQYVQMEKSAAKQRKSPATMQFVGAMAAEIGKDRKFGISSVGVQYGPQSATITEIIVDRLNLRIPMLSQQSRPYGDMLQGAVRCTRDAAYAYAQLEQNLLLAAIPKTDSAWEGTRDRGVREALHAVDGAYRLWLSELSPEGDEERQTLAAEKCAVDWQKKCLGIIRALQKRRSSRLTAAEITGRKNGEYWMNAANAEAIFDRKIRTILPKAFTQSEINKGEAS